MPVVVIVLNNPYDIGHLPTILVLVYVYCVVWLWVLYPAHKPRGRVLRQVQQQTSAVVLATTEMFARVCSRKMMGPSHASDFLATTKVRIQLWSSLNRCLGQSSQRGYNTWCKGHENPPVQPTIHPLDAHYDSVWYNRWPNSTSTHQRTIQWMPMMTFSGMTGPSK